MRPRAEAGQLNLPETPKKKKKAAEELAEPSEVSDENNEG
jgi:hypothetical protein